jgi:hypothetical protein
MSKARRTLPDTDDSSGFDFVSSDDGPAAAVRFTSSLKSVAPVADFGSAAGPDLFAAFTSRVIQPPSGGEFPIGAIATPLASRLNPISPAAALAQPSFLFDAPNQQQQPASLRRASSDFGAFETTVPPVQAAVQIDRTLPAGFRFPFVPDPDNTELEEDIFNEYDAYELLRPLVESLR